MLNIVIVEDHTRVREQLASVLAQVSAWRVLPVCRDWEEGKQLIELTCPDVLLVDLSLPRGGDGTTLIRRASQLWGARCLSCVLIADRMEDSLLDAIRAGAKGYLNKDQPADQWPAVIQALLRHESPLNHVLAQVFHRTLTSQWSDAQQAKQAPLLELLKYIKSGYQFTELHGLLQMSVSHAARMARQAYDMLYDEGCVLSAQQLQLLRLFDQGLTELDCAQKLDIKPSTIKTQRQRMYEKLQASDRTQAVHAARRLGLL